MRDYSKTIFSQGIVCKNNNNNAYCVVIDGTKGTENDSASMGPECTFDDGFMVHTSPNRALTPTGRICRLESLRKILDQHVVERNM